MAAPCQAGVLYRGGRPVLILGAIICGFVLDRLLGDPSWMPHPVVWMGRVIAGAERFLRPRLPATPRGELFGGLLLALFLPCLTLAVSGGICVLAFRLHPIVGFLVQTVWCWQALAARGLAEEGRRVWTCAAREDLPEARAAVSRIVGRDTQNLTMEGVIKATVETIAENFSDGVAAPLLYMVLGGAPLALVYKSINTMDSMVGYRNSRYLYFGRAAAKLDDAVNYIPARIAAWLWIGAAALSGQDAAGAVRIWRRDARRHASPNSAQTESACAGALGVQLAGPAWYFGEYYEKPTIGDAVRPVEAADILRANRMLETASWLALAAGVVIRVLLVWGT